MAAIREVFSSGPELDRDAAIAQVAHAAGFRRTGSRITEAIDSGLIAAVRRRIVRSQRGLLSIDCRNVGDYPRDLLMSSLLAAMGFAWREREEGIRVAARRLGFRRTGSSIRDAFKSVINGAIRRGLIETDGKLIRKTRS
jgi:hypothetical protein